MLFTLLKEVTKSCCVATAAGTQVSNPSEPMQTRAAILARGAEVFGFMNFAVDERLDFVL